MGGEGRFLFDLLSRAGTNIYICQLSLSQHVVKKRFVGGN